jgi:Glyoxalase-like domain
VSPALRAARLVIDATDLDRAAAFWAALLDLDVGRRAADWIDLSPLGHGGPVLSIQLVPEGKNSKNRLHLDIAIDETEGGAVVAGYRALALGATPASELFAADAAPWQVWRDPDGNEFCLCTESIGESEAVDAGSAY